ncbi:MAG: cytochrome c biogenesis protein CcdA [Candidatus Bathyarchaeia archaeon]
MDEPPVDHATVNLPGVAVPSDVVEPLRTIAMMFTSELMLAFMVYMIFHMTLVFSAFVRSQTETSWGPAASPKLSFLRLSATSTVCYALVFSAFGVSALALTRLTLADAFWVRTVGGTLSVLFGVNLAGIVALGPLVTCRAPRALRVRASLKPLSTGLSLGVFCGTCCGPLMFTMILLSGIVGSLVSGFYVFIAVSAVMAAPSLLIAAWHRQCCQYLERALKHIQITTRIGGVLLIAFGVLLVVGWM